MPMKTSIKRRPLNSRSSKVLRKSMTTLSKAKQRMHIKAHRVDGYAVDRDRALASLLGDGNL